MRKNLIKNLIALFLVVVANSFLAQAQEESMVQLMANITTTLDLSDTQVPQVEALLTQYRGKLDGILLKYEDQEEPEVDKMIGEIRDVRDSYRKDLEGLLSPDQYTTYIAQVDGILTDMFQNLAEIRLMEVQPQVDLTDGQVESLVPIVGKSMLSTVRLLFENAGKRLSLPKKIGIKNDMKKIEKEKRAGMEKIMTDAQMDAYDAYKEEQKAKKK
jgi:hypothetical protein